MAESAVMTENKKSSNTVWLAVLVFTFTLLMFFMVASMGKSISLISIEQKILHLEDIGSTLTFTEIRAKDESQWVENKNQNFGLTQNAQWLKTIFDANKSNRLVEIDYAMLDEIDIWLVKGSLQNGEVMQKYQTGDKVPFLQRPIVHDKFLFNLPKSLDKTTVLLRIRSNGPVKAPMNIWTESNYVSYISTHRLFIGLFFGYMIAMGLINLFIFVTTRNLIYATYSGYVFAFALLIASLHGIGFRFMWPDNTWLQERSVVIFAYMMMSFVLIFTARILELRKNHPRFYLAIRILVFVYVGCCVASFVVPYAIMVKLLLILFLFSIPVVLFVIVSLAAGGSTIAKYFTAAWGVLLCSGLAASADNFHWIDLPIDSSYLLMIGATTETLLLALAMATNYSERRRLARLSSIEASENEQQALSMQDEVLALQKQAQIDLEKEVQARTSEFDKALSKLASINTNLQNMNEVDALTGVMNRQQFDKVYAEECARSRRERKPLALAMLDIDHFKQVNDTFGHQSGDDCLVAFCDAIKRVIKRPSDVVARFGGEEFVMLLPNTTVEGASGLLEACRQAVVEIRVPSGKQQIEFTVSIGLSAKVIGDDEDKEKLIAFADKLLYAAKDAGRDCIKSGNF